jgi:hypothetical protein
MSYLTIPSEAHEALLIVQKRLAESLVAVYLHGSAVTGGLRPVELIVFLRTNLVASLFPAQSQFIYGEWLRHE